MKPPLLVQKQVAVAIWKLATPGCYTSVANQFGVGKVVGEVSQSIRHVVYPKVASIKDIPEVTADFERMGFSRLQWGH